MKRTTGTVLVSICEIVIGLFFLLMAMMMVWLVGRSLSNPTPGVPSMKLLFAVTGAIYGGLGALAIATAIGLLSGRNWARILTIVAGAMLAFVGFVGALIMAMMPLPAVPNVTEHQLRLLRVSMSGFWVLVALIGIWWAVLLTRPRIEELFRSGEAAVPATRMRPLSISIIAGVFLFAGSIGFLVQFAMRTPILLLGHLFTGATAFAINSLLTLTYVALGIGLLRLDRRALYGSFGIFAFAILNGLVVSMLPGRAELMNKILRASPGYGPQQASGMQWIFSPWYLLLFNIFFVGIPLYFLITRRAAFYPPPDAEITETLVV